MNLDLTAEPYPLAEGARPAQGDDDGAAGSRRVSLCRSLTYRSRMRLVWACVWVWVWVWVWEGGAWRDVDVDNGDAEGRKQKGSIVVASHRLTYLACARARATSARTSAAAAAAAPSRPNKAAVALDWPGLNPATLVDSCGRPNVHPLRRLVYTSALPLLPSLRS